MKTYPILSPTADLLHRKFDPVMPLSDLLRFTFIYKHAVSSPECRIVGGIDGLEMVLGVSVSICSGFIHFLLVLVDRL